MHPAHDLGTPGSVSEKGSREVMHVRAPALPAQPIPGGGFGRGAEPPSEFPGVSAGDQVSLCEALDRVLNKGAVVLGEVTISVADIDLIYLGLQVVLTSIETGRGLGMMTTLAGARASGAGKEMADGAC